MQEEFNGKSAWDTWILGPLFAAFGALIVLTPQAKPVLAIF
jgi:hypothetical protein